MNGDEDQDYSFENILEMWLKRLPLPSEIKFNRRRSAGVVELARLESV